MDKVKRFKSILSSISLFVATKFELPPLSSKAATDFGKVTPISRANARSGGQINDVCKPKIDSFDLKQASKQYARYVCQEKQPSFNKGID